VERIGSFFNDMSFKSKILMAFIFIALIPLSVLGIFSYKTIRSMLINKETMYLEATFAQTSQILDSTIGIYDNAIRSLCFNRQLINLNQTNYTSDYDRYESLNFIDDLFVTTQNLVPKVEYITLFTNSNMGVHGNTVRSMEEIRSSKWYDFISDTAPSWLYDGNRIYCVHPMLDSGTSDRNRSYIVMQIKVETLEEILRIVDAQNISVVIRSQGNDVICNNGNPQDVNELIDQIPSLNELYIDDNQFVSIKDYVKGTEWMMVMSASYHDILMSTYLYSAIVIIIILSCFFVVFVVSIWFSKKMLVRIDELKRNMAEVEDGSFVVNVKSSSKDEIGELIRGFSAMIVKINELIEKNYKATLEKKVYELKALQAQINPHFLYNSLSLINWRALRIDAPEISELARLLSDFYRTTLNKGNSMTIVRQEMLNIKSYLQIQQIMHNDSFRVEYQIEDMIGNCFIPNLTLQPLVENAIVHGLEKSDAPGRLTITAVRKNDDIHIIIKDNGAGIPSPSLENILETESQGGGYGLKNVNQRIKLFFGEEYGMSIESVLEQGTVVTVRIPARYGNNDRKGEEQTSGARPF